MLCEGAEGHVIRVDDFSAERIGAAVGGAGVELGQQVAGLCVLECVHVGVGVGVLE